MNREHKTGSIKFLEKNNIDCKLLDISLSSDCLLVFFSFFLHFISKAKPNEQDYIKLKSSYIAKETINKMKSQLIEWEKIFTNHVSDKGLIF